MSIESSIIQMAKAGKKPEKQDKPEKTQAELRQILTEKMESLRVSTLAQLDIYEEKLEKGEFDDQESEPVGNGEKRQLHMQKEILNADGRIDKMKAILDSGDELPQEPILDIEALKTENQAILTAVFGTPDNKFTPSLIKPEDQDYAVLKSDIDQAKFGEYTLNPDTQNQDFENIPEGKIFIPDLSSFVGKELHEVAKYLIDNFSDKYKIHGVEYWKWLYENPAKTPDKLKDGKYYFEFGSLVRNSGGHWYVPYARLAGSEWFRYANWLSYSWNSHCRVVLLEI